MSIEAPGGELLPWSPPASARSVVTGTSPRARDIQYARYSLSVLDFAGTDPALCNPAGGEAESLSFTEEELALACAASARSAVAAERDEAAQVRQLWGWIRAASVARDMQRQPTVPFGLVARDVESGTRLQPTG